MRQSVTKQRYGWLVHAQKICRYKHTRAHTHPISRMTIRIAMIATAKSMVTPSKRCASCSRLHKRATHSTCLSHTNVQGRPIMVMNLRDRHGGRHTNGAAADDDEGKDAKGMRLIDQLVDMAAERAAEWVLSLLKNALSFQR